MGLGLKWRKLNFWEVGLGVNFLISGSDSNSGSCNRFVGSFMTCVQNLNSFRIDLIGFGVVCENLKFQSSLGMNWGMIRGFSIV